MESVTEKAKATVYPQNKTHNHIAAIYFTDEKVKVFYKKDDDFYDIVRNDLGYRWNGSEWEKEITHKTGTAEDRTAELGNKLLNAGFPIRIYDDKVRKKAINADYEPEQTQWISRTIEGEYKDWFVITWDYDEDYYHKARSLSKSKYNGHGGVVIKKEYHQELEEFAEIFDFKFSPGAKELLKIAKEEEKILQENSVTVSPAKPKEKENSKNGLEEILESDDGILPDLRDD